MPAPAAGVTADQQRPVVPLHTAVPGRARFKIADLYGNEDLKRSLEVALARRSEVVKASGNVLTGNILVLFEKATPLESVQAWLKEAALRDGGRGDARHRRARPDTMEQN